MHASYFIRASMHRLIRDRGPTTSVRVERSNTYVGLVLFVRLFLGMFPFVSFAFRVDSNWLVDRFASAALGRWISRTYDGTSRALGNGLKELPPRAPTHARHGSASPRVRSIHCATTSSPFPLPPSPSFPWAEKKLPSCGS